MMTHREGRGGKDLKSKRLLCCLLFACSSNILAAPLFQFVLPGSKEPEVKVSLIPFDAAIYELAYKAYLQSGDIKDAYTVAAAAVAQKPGIKVWRDRLATVAIWNEKPGVALKEYAILSQDFKDSQAETRGLYLARKMNDDELLIPFLSRMIKKNQPSPKDWADYIATMFRLGELKDLAATLNAHRKSIPVAEYLESFSTMNLVLDEPQKQLVYLKELSKQVGVTPKIASQLAVIYLGQGKLKPAVTAMNEGRKRASRSDYPFWIDYAQISSLAQRTGDEIVAYQHLIEQKKPDLDIYNVLIGLVSNSDPALAYRYFSQALKIYPNDESLLSSAVLLLNNKELSFHFPNLLAQIPSALMAQIKASQFFWIAKANYWRSLDNDDAVVQAYLEGIKTVAHNEVLKSELLSFLISKNSYFLLRELLAQWQQTAIETPELWGVYAQAYAQLPNKQMSQLYLSLLYEQFPIYQNNPRWLIFFKDSLENSNVPRAAEAITQYAWPLYLHSLQTGSIPPYEAAMNYVKLSLQEASGDPTAVALKILENLKDDEDVELLMLTWAIKHNNFSLAKRAYWYYLMHGISPQAWAILSIAYHEQDRNWERKIIMNKKKPIASYRDHVAAAIHIDAIPYAQSVAYKELVKHRDDSDLYDHYFVPTMLRTADFIHAEEEYYQYGNLAGPRNHVAYRYFFTPGLSLMPFNSLWLPKDVSKKTEEALGSDEANIISANKNQVFASVPHYDERAGIKAVMQARRGLWDLDLIFRKNLASFWNAKLVRTYPIYNNLQSTGTLGIRMPADDTAGLLIGGMKNQALLEMAYTLFAKDTLFGSYAQNQFYTQDGQYLSNGIQALLRLEHKFWREYPDWNISPYVVATRYYHQTNQPLRGNILSIVPEGVNPTVNFLIPASFLEYGATIAVGQNYIEEYTHRWHPLALFTLSQNSVIGLGKLLNVGLAGTLFGRDHLLLYYEWGSNQGQGLQLSQLLKLSYKIYW